MEKKYFSLGTVENGRLIKIIRVLFGIICLAVTVFWLLYNLKALKVDKTLWITILFLTGFGLYQIWSGLGYATKFIEIGPEGILLKKSSLLPAVMLNRSDIEKIELFPMNLIFFLKSGKKLILRFGAMYQDTNESIKDEIIAFADSNNISLEIKEEKI